jgi:hypothetical protein
MKAISSAFRLFIQLLLLLIAGIAFGGCPIKLVADYDATAFEEIIKTGKKVDRFFGDLLETPASERQYRKYSASYVEIETDLRSLYTRNRVRALNTESSEISDIILKLWVKYKTNHASNNDYPDTRAKLDRARFTRLFISAADAEIAKKLDANDRDPEKESMQPEQLRRR